MSNLIILKTEPRHLLQVVAIEEHALPGELNAKPGDLLLLAEKQRVGEALIKYGMWLQHQEQATPERIASIWGSENKGRWKWRIIGERHCQLLKPFGAERERVHSPREYARGGTVVHVHPADAELWWQKGLLSPLSQ